MAGNSRPQIVIDILASAGKAKAEIDKLHSQLQGRFSKISGLAKGVGLAMAGAGAGAIALAKSAVASAGDLEQSVGAVDTVFKGSAAQMHTWAKGAATSVGLTRNEFNELGTLIGTQLKNGGTAMEDLAPKTNNLIKLGADLSSMFGGSTRDAVEALSSALKGERDPIERYGVSLNQAKIDAEAAALGFKKVGGSLSTEANQAATLSLIMKQTADAHGNFARESETLAHKQQVLHAKLENIKTTVGTALLPVVTKVADIVLTKAVPAIEKFAASSGDKLGPLLTQIGTFIATVLIPTLAQILPILGSLLTAISPIITLLSQTLLPALNAVATALAAHPALVTAVIGALGLLGAGIAAYSTFVKTAEGATKGFALAQKALNLAMKANPIMLVISIIAMLIAVLIEAWQTNEQFRNTVIGAWEAIKTATVTIWTAIKDFFISVWEGIKTAFITYLNFVLNFWKTVWNVIQTVFVTVWNTIKTFALATWEMLKTAFSAFLKFLQDLWTKVWNAIKTFFINIWNAIKSAAIAVWNAIKAAFTAWLNFMKNLWETVWNAIKTFFINAWHTMQQVFTTVMNTMRNLVKTTMDKIVAFFKSAWETAKKIVTDAWNAVVNSIKTGIDNAVKWVSGLGSRVKSAIGNLGNLLLGPGKALLDGFLRGISQGWETVKKKVSGFASWIKDHKGPLDYDRVLLEPAGKAIMDGLMNGIESKRATLRNQLNSLSNDISGNTFKSPGFELGALNGSYSMKKNHQPEIHITVNALTPTAEVGRVVVQALDEYYEINGRGR